MRSTGPLSIIYYVASLLLCCCCCLFACLFMCVIGDMQISGGYLADDKHWSGEHDIATAALLLLVCVQHYIVCSICCCLCV